MYPILNLPRVRVLREKILQPDMVGESYTYTSGRIFEDLGKLISQKKKKRTKPKNKKYQSNMSVLTPVIINWVRGRGGGKGLPTLLLDFQGSKINFKPERPLVEDRTSRDPWTVINGKILFSTRIVEIVSRLMFGESSKHDPYFLFIEKIIWYLRRFCPITHISWWIEVTFSFRKTLNV